MFKLKFYTSLEIRDLQDLEKFKYILRSFVQNVKFAASIFRDIILIKDLTGSISILKHPLMISKFRKTNIINFGLIQCEMLR